MTKSRDLANAATALNAVTAAELGYVDGVTSAIQTQLDAKLASSTAATTYVANTLADAKGDIFVASADNTVTRLPVGSTGDTIVADSSTSTGLRYTAGNPIPNPVLNSAYQVWQRGTSFSLAANTGQTYTADRWVTYTNANQACTVSRQATGDTTNLPNIQYALRYQRNSGQTGTSAQYLCQMIESINSVPYAGKTVTFSFYARAGANYSSSGNALYLYLQSGTGTDQNYFAGYTGNATAATGTATLTTTWQRFTYTGTVSSSASELAILFSWASTGTAGAADYFEVTGIQMDIGSVALPFRTNGATIQGELAACQRYYWRAGGQTTYQAFGTGIFESSTGAWLVIENPVTMRSAPGSVDWSTLAVYDGGTIRAITALPAGELAANICRINVSVASGGTQFRPVQLFANNSTSAYIGFSAEL